MIVISNHLLTVLFLSTCILNVHHVHCFVLKLSSLSKLKSSSISKSIMFVSNTNDDNLVTTYSGPIRSMNDMEAGCTVEDLRLKILVGKSTVNGRGLFISLDDDVEEVIIPKGTPICGYSKGTFTNSASGVYTVAYIFEDINVAVFLNKELISLKKAISNVAAKRDILIDAVKDHSLYYDDEIEEIIIVPNLENARNYFIPFTDVDENDKDWSISRMGIYANDLAYHKDISEDEYINTRYEKNVLQLIWRLECSIDDKLVPTYPVIIVNQDLKFTNYEPMEVGLTYSYRYWLAATKSTTASFASSTNQ